MIYMYAHPIVENSPIKTLVAARAIYMYICTCKPLVARWSHMLTCSCTCKHTHTFTFTGPHMYMHALTHPAQGCGFLQSIQTESRSCYQTLDGHSRPQRSRCRRRNGSSSNPSCCSDDPSGSAPCLSRRSWSERRGIRPWNDDRHTLHTCVKECTVTYVSELVMWYCVLIWGWYT